MKKVVAFLLKYKYQILLLILYILFFLQMQNVFYYADDYSILVSDKYNIHNYIDFLSWFFYDWSGRLLGHFLVLIILNFGNYVVFRVLNPIFLFCICFFLARIIDVKKKYNQSQLIFLFSLVFVGLNVKISKEILYWTYGTVLYLWGSLPLFIIVYFLLDCIINDKEMSKCRFVVCCVLFFIVSFFMESTLIFGIVFLLFILQDKKLKSRKSIKRILLFSIFCLVLLLLIPGNIARLRTENGDLNFLSSFIYKMKDYFNFLFNTSSIIRCIFMLSVISNINLLKKSKSLFNFVCSVFLLCFNIVILFCFLLSIKINFINLNNGFFIVTFIYLILNVYNFFISFKDGQKKYYMYLVIAGICSSLVSILLVSYNIYRFYLLLIVSMTMLLLYCYFNSNKKQRFLILLLYSIFINYYISILLLIVGLIYCLKKFDYYKINKLLICLFVGYHLFCFGDIMYHYYVNSKAVRYNNEKLYYIRKYKSELEKNGFSNISLMSFFDYNGCIELKRIKYEEYSYHTADNYDYVLEWYKNYFKINDYEISWIDS